MSTVRFGAGKLVALQLTDATGAALAVPQPREFLALQSVDLDFSFEQKELYAASKFPIAIAQGKGKISGKAKTGRFSPHVFGELFLGRQSTSGISAVVFDEPKTIPSSASYTVTITPANSATFVNNLGVKNAATGDVFKRVASSPAAGEYSLTGAVYTFNAGDQGKGILISYEYAANSGGTTYAIRNDLMGQQPTFSVVAQTTYEGKTLSIKLNSCVLSKHGMGFKNDDFMQPDIEFGAFADAADNVGMMCLF